MPMFQHPWAAPRVLLLAISVLALSACDSDDNNNAQPVQPTTNEPTTPIQAWAFVSTRASDFSAGRIDRISITDGDVVNGSYPATGSDIRVRTDGSHVYELGRFNLDSLTKYAPDDTSTAVYQYSVNGEESGSNPYDVVFVNDSKAYVLRYGSSSIWVINPNAASEAEFRTGEIDLAAYDSDDGNPEPSGGVLVGDRLFVLLERVNRNEGFAPNKSSYIAVIDTNTDQEINTSGAADGELQGIELNTRNATALTYSAARNQLFVTGRGNYFASDDSNGDRYTGGVERIDPTSYAVTLLSDDGSEADHPHDFYSQMLPVTADKGYLLTYASFGSTTLRSFNLQTGAIAEAAVAGLENMDITALALDSQNRVWVGLNQNQTPGFRLLNSADDSELKSLVATELVPMNVVFIQQ